MTMDWKQYLGGGGGGSTSTDYDLLQRIAYTFGVNPWKLTPQQIAQYAAILQVQELSSQHPDWQQIDATHWISSNGRVQELTRDSKGNPTFNEWTAGDSKAWLAENAAGGGGSGGGGSRLASDDPRYWEMQQKQLEAQYMNMGLDAESARRQALTTLITNRNNTAADTAQISANVAKQIADFAANPRDAVAELMYRNQVGGSTPFGDLTNDNFGEYGRALAEKAASIFQPVGQDIQQLRTYRDTAFPVEFTAPSSAVQQVTGGGTAPIASPTAAAPAPNPLQALRDRLESMNTQQQYDFRKWTDPDFRAKNPGPAPFAEGGQINFEGLFESRSKPGYSPASSEGGTNLNLHERAVVVGESGHVYATLGEKRPDGTMRAEQLIIKPLKSEVEKDKKMAEGNKAVVETQKQTMASFAGGGTVSATPDDFMEQLRQYLGSLGGSGGGTGQVSTPLQSPRLLAGAPYERLLEDPDLLDYTRSGFSALGISPRNLEATIRKFTPSGIINNSPRVSF